MMALEAFLDSVSPSNFALLRLFSLWQILKAMMSNAIYFDMASGMQNSMQKLSAICCIPLEFHASCLQTTVVHTTQVGEL